MPDLFMRQTYDRLSSTSRQRPPSRPRHLPSLALEPKVPVPNSCDPQPFQLSRRGFLLAGAGAGAALLLPACGRRTPQPAGGGAPGEIVLVARRSTVDLAGKEAKTWTYGGQLPGREIRVKQGERVRVRVENDLKEPTSIH